MGRIRSLDGLRGLLAMAVLLHHCMLTAPISLGLRQDGIRGPLTWSPLHLLWAGGEAVDAFFVLSGFVLVGPMLDATEDKWRAYYVQRLTRLYLPIWAAALLALCVLKLYSRHLQAGMSDWMPLNIGPYGVGDFFHDTLIVGGVNPVLNGPFWSLQWEVLFSILLPLVVIVLRWVRQRPLVLHLLLAVTLGIGFVTNRYSHAGFVHDTVVFMPMFCVGALLACYVDVLRRAMAWMDARTGFIAVVWAAAVLLFVSDWLKPAHTLRFGQAVPTLGSALLIILFAFSASGKRLGTARIVSWLGIRSYSLYLIHAPIVVTLAFALFSLGGYPWTVMLFAVPLSLCVTAVFYRFVERPSHLLARRLGALTSRAPAAVP